MNNHDHAVLAQLLHNFKVVIDVVTSEGGGDFDVCVYEFTIYVPEIQMLQTKTDSRPALDYDYDGIHQYDYPDYVGIGYSIEEAWQNFCEKMDVMYIEDSIEKAIKKISEESEV